MVWRIHAISSIRRLFSEAFSSLSRSIKKGWITAVSAWALINWKWIFSNAAEFCTTKIDEPHGLCYEGFDLFKESTKGLMKYSGKSQNVVFLWLAYCFLPVLLGKGLRPCQTSICWAELLVDDTSVASTPTPHLPPYSSFCTVPHKQAAPTKPFPSLTRCTHRINFPPLGLSEHWV